MNMCRFKSARVAGYIDFKAALGGYLDEINTKAGQIIIRTQTESGEIGAAEHKGL
jgi:hypothetical protein